MVAPPTRLGASEEGRLTPQEPLPRRAERPASPGPADRGTAPSPGRPGTGGPALPTRAGEDTDEGWGELPESPDDARYLRDRPPHWE